MAWWARRFLFLMANPSGALIGWIILNADCKTRGVRHDSPFASFTVGGDCHVGSGV
jgi:hypothetical protein